MVREADAMSDKVRTGVTDVRVGETAHAAAEVDERAVFNDPPGSLSAHAQAYALRLQGTREADIPELTDLLAGEVRETLEDQARRAQESHLEEVAIALELDRLDAMLAGLWAAATSGDCAAVDRVLKIGERRDKLLGLHLEGARQKFTSGAATDDLEGLSQEELQVLANLAARKAGAAASKANIGSRKTRGGKPHRASIKGGQ